jgi:uncharacterized protein (TIGR02118 family)
MLKLTFCLIRRPDFTPEAFHDYWLNRHAPLVASVREVLRIRRYVQLHSLPPGEPFDPGAPRGAPPGYDGVAQLWWDSAEDLAATADDPAAADAGRLLLEDERRFIDLSRSPLWWGEEHVIF